MNNTIFNKPLDLDVLTQISKMFPEASSVSDLVFYENTNFPSTPYGMFNAKLTNHSKFLSMYLKSLTSNCFIAIENSKMQMTVVDYASLKGLGYYVACIIHLEKGTKKVSFNDTSNWTRKRGPANFYEFKENLQESENVIFAIPYRNNELSNSITIKVIEDTDGSAIVEYNRGYVMTQEEYDEAREMLEG